MSIDANYGGAKASVSGGALFVLIAGIPLCIAGAVFLDKWTSGRR